MGVSANGAETRVLVPNTHPTRPSGGNTTNSTKDRVCYLVSYAHKESKARPATLLTSTMVAVIATPLRAFGEGHHIPPDLTLLHRPPSHNAQHPPRIQSVCSVSCFPDPSVLASRYGPLCAENTRASRSITRPASNPAVRPVAGLDHSSLLNPQRVISDGRDTDARGRASLYLWPILKLSFETGTMIQYRYSMPTSTSTA